MAIQIKNLERVAEAVRSAIPDYVSEIERIFAGHALSLCMFGTAVAGGFDKNRHSARNVLVLREVKLEQLQELSRNGAKLGKAGIAAPLIMTPEYIEVSLDTFPLELLEIQQSHIPLFGPDHFSELSFDDGHIRHECERELKSVLIGMRQGLLAAAGRRKFIESLDVDVAERLIRVLRGFLWIKGVKTPQSGTQVVEEVESLIGKKLRGLAHALRSSESHDWNEFQSLYADVETLRRIVDEM